MVSRPTPSAGTRLEVLSHLSVFAAAYVAGAVVCFAQLADVRMPGRAWALAIPYALGTAAAVYLLDRVKLGERLLDPADRLAHPSRSVFLEKRQSAVRLAILLLLLASMLPGAAISPYLPMLSIGACVGVLAYAGRPRGRRDRIKDRIGLKNTFVAAGITAFSMLVILLAASPELAHQPWRLPGTVSLAHGASSIYLFVRVFADAALCDLDDEHADREHGTRTLATGLGRSCAWTVAMLIRLTLSVCILAVPEAPLASRTCWAVLTAGSSILLRLRRPERVRDWVDSRLAIEAVIAALVLRALG